jgi:asparagine synthase (glutamine-hydrolysing)
MVGLMKHRGPDDEGFWTGGSWGIGHCRLSIIDSKRGKQPMGNEDGTVWVVFNGEIYNHAELRSRLTERGHIFKTKCDTEVLVHLFEEYGSGCVDHLNGMFALCIIDTVHRTAFLARDRFGIKPLYYSCNSDALVFASEIRALVDGYGIERDINPEAVLDHFTFQYTLGDKTWFRGVSMLEPGHYGMFKDGCLSIRQYWDFQFVPEDMDEKTALDRLDEAFSRSLKRHLMSDVPLGSYLSGGNDSSAICLYAKKHVEDLKTFTCGFSFPRRYCDERCVDERPFARESAEFLNTSHHELNLTSEDIIGSIDSVSRYLEEPMAGISYQIYLLSEFVSRHIRVVLVGVGGDELFAGYPWRYETINPEDDYDAFRNNYYSVWSRIVPSEERDSFFSPEFLKATGGYNPKDAFFEIMDRCNSPNYIEKAHYYEIKTFLRALLFVEDKLSMAHSIESRVPFLDNEIVDVVCQMPLHIRYNRREIKHMLLKLLKRHLPDKLLQGRKLGFTPPDATWFRMDNRNFLMASMNGNLSRLGMFQGKKIDTYLNEFLSGCTDRRFLFWSLLMTEKILHNRADK